MTAFPEHGTSWADLSQEFDTATGADADWRAGRVPLYVFHANDTVSEIGRNAYNRFFSENALGARRAFGSLKRMEEEVVAMALDLFNAPDGAAGHMTSGGSESIFLAVKAAREHHRARHGGRTALNMVLPASGHPAFDKAAQVMDIEVRRVPLGSDLRADVEAMARVVDGQTVLILGSAPCFPHGIFDPLAALSALAASTGTWLHVDACVGGYLTPFARAIGRPVPEFDLALPGVASLSADLHKYGFTPKPASTVFFRRIEDMERNAFAFDDWPNGNYLTRTMTGTRPGGAIAGAWAVLRHLGRSGYEQVARDLFAMVDGYAAGIRAIPGLALHAEPELAILNWGWEEGDIFAVAERMAERGWVPGLTQRPKGMHAMLSMLHAPARERYLADLASAVEAARGSASAGISASY
ncbi:aspartate aminotransferase family protein [Paralimibaculum aggregatum]|uniref:Aspartate aminotransferase family protein n=1 Tax=Paralimibaculum aggregatum TaxID=3036245 RepID=A0ABQ6LKC1_9RHOB|nr:pyridoxal-dependent decarboxylase [Limibaculum sp. NKW23]GMG82117.1 aspartate aminotransferase family protein [Limibaculum sp. NKW23]